MSRKMRLILALGLALVGLQPLSVRGIQLDAKARQFRASFGLSTDPQVPADEAFTSTSIRTYGVPLTGVEEADIDARFALPDQIGPLIEFVSAHPKMFGGVWLDQISTHGHGTIIDVGITSLADDWAISMVRGFIPAATSVAFVTADYGLEELNAAADSALSAAAADPTLRIIWSAG